MSLVTTPAILLRSYPYSESSLILRFFTPDLGIVGVMARGARSRRRGAGTPLDTFAEGALTLYVRAGRDLQTLKEFSVTESHRALAGHLVRFAGASVVADIVLHHAGEEANQPLYDCLRTSLAVLGTVDEDSLVAAALAAGWRTVVALGYAPSLEACVECGRVLETDEMGRFDFGAGGLRCSACAPPSSSGPRIGPGARAQLEELVGGSLPASLRRSGAHLRLLRDFVAYHVSGKGPLASFQFLMEVVEGSDA